MLPLIGGAALKYYMGMLIPPFSHRVQRGESSV